MEKKLTRRQIRKYTGIPASTYSDFTTGKYPLSKRTRRKIIGVIEAYCSNRIKEEKAVKGPTYYFPTREPSPEELDLEEERLSSFSTTGRLSPEEVAIRVKNLKATLRIDKCPWCGGSLSPSRNKESKNHFLGCNNYKTGCKWTKTLFEKYSY